MKKHTMVLALAISILFSLGFSYADDGDVENSPIKLEIPKAIMHAGGEIYGEYLTNSKESIEKSLKNGFNYVEVDFSWTYDDKPVLAHDWGTFSKLFEVERKHYTLKEFNNTKNPKYTQLDLGDLINLLEENDDLIIVTDAKSENVKLLSIISSDYSDYINRFIPQIYCLSEYDEVKNLGFENIIFTLYRAPESDEEVIKISKELNLFAVTMPIARADNEFVNTIKESETPVFVHTLNEKSQIKSVLNQVDGVYTDVGYNDKIDFNNVNLNICYMKNIKCNTMTTI
jgi:glycerophosphoryl diester phosphodiesterase